MKTIILLPLCAITLLPYGVGRAGAEPPKPAVTGKVLVLENENTMEGDVERVGDQYRIRRVVGETWVPAGRVLALCASLNEAYVFVRSRANLKDPDERLRLARWCRANGLRDQAIVEVRAAVELRPGHAETRRLLAHLEQSQAARGPAAPAHPIAPEVPPPKVDLTADSLALFANRVQPILMNTCAQCHTEAHGGAFKLVRSYEVGLTNRKTLQQNLAAVLAQVNVGQPQASPLLTKAVCDHGKVGQPPLRGRQAPTSRMLEDWVRLTLDNNPQLHEQMAIAGDAKPPAPRAEFASGKDTPPPSPAPAVKEAARLAPAGPADPFDPDEFNRQAHPDKLKGR